MRNNVLLAVAAIAAVPAARAADTYVIDPSHTFPTWEVRHLGFSTFRGRFDRTSGTITFDPVAKTGSAEITIDAASVSSGVEKLDQHLRNADFLDVEKYPVITFKSREFRFEGDRLVAVEGDLTMLGVTRPVTLEVDSLVCKEHPMAKVPACGADAHTTIKRSEWGMKYLVPAVGDEVTLRIQVEALSQSAGE